MDDVLPDRRRPRHLFPGGQAPAYLPFTTDNDGILAQITQTKRLADSETPARSRAWRLTGRSPAERFTFNV